MKKTKFKLPKRLKEIKTIDIDKFNKNRLIEFDKIDKKDIWVNPNQSQ